MAKILKFKRGNTAKNTSYTGADGELTVDTSKKTVIVHDGVTAGGSVLATESLVGTKINAAEKGVENGVSTLDINGKVVLSQIPDSILGQLEYMGVYDFASGMPTATEKGQYWIASTNGNGYDTGDWAVWNGLLFDKVDNTDAVSSVAGRTGNITLTSSDVGLGNIDNTSDLNKPISTATQTALNTTVKLTGNQTIAGVKTFSSNIAGNITGNSATATKLQTARTIAMSGDVSGSTTFDGSGNVSIVTTVADDSHNHSFDNLTSKPTTLQGYGVTPEEMPAGIDLDTKTTTGLYSQSQNSEATLALKYPVAVAGLLEVFTYNNMIHQRYWAYNSDDIYYRAKYGTASWTSWTKGANVDDTVAAATKLQTARTINGVSFDGTANIVAPTNLGITAGTTAGPIVTSSSGTNVTLPSASATASGVVTTGDQTIAGVKTFSSTISGSITGNAGTATKLATARNINGVAFDGTANITIADDTKTPLNGAGASGTWGISVTGNSGTATKLQTARTISISGGATGTATSFDGTGNISIPVTGLNASNLSSGTVPDARLSGIYSGMSLKLNGNNTVFTTESSGSANISRTVYGLAEYKNNNSTTTGAIVFIAPSSPSAVMHQLEVSGLLYNNNIVSLIVQGYRTSEAWSDLRKISTGTVDIQVRWGITPDGKHCLILGDVGTVWSYPHIAITRAMFSYTGTSDDYCTGWTAALVTDFTGYTNISANIGDSTMIGNVTSATKLQTARTIGGVSFNGSANINLPGVNTAGNQNTSGNSATATKLQTARTINGVAFDGTANITVSDSTAVKLTGDETVAGVKTFSSGIIGNITGNAGTATTLATARTINGVAFDGSANITIVDSTKAPLASPALTGTPTAPTAAVGTNTTQLATTAFVNAEIANDAPTKTGAGASGTWGISVTGNSGTATKLQTARTINGVAFDGSANITVSDSTAVKLTGNQTIAGVKTFSSSPIVPTPTTGTQAVNKSYADLKVALSDFIGSNQNLALSGYQKLPGGLIIQWGVSAITIDNVDIYFPISFPNSVFHINEHDIAGKTGTNRTLWQFRNVGNTAFNALNMGVLTKDTTTFEGSTLSGCCWFAIGC